MTYEEAIRFIHGLQWRGSIPGLTRIRELLRRMGNPQDSLRFVHIAGTNGKGSTAAMLASVLTRAGLRTGLCTSPYISRFEERIQLCGVPISPAELAEATSYVAPFALEMEDGPTEFELICAITMACFARHKCDIVVLEVGMGGRLDATNVIRRPECAVITNIGLDHTDELGDTLEKIALEKAGIIKPGAPTVLYPQTRSVMDTVAGVCAQRGSALTAADLSRLEPLADSREGQRFRFGGEEYFLPLLGEHQLKNAAVALTVLEQLRTRGWSIPREAVRQGLAEVRWPSRFEILSRRPWFVVDGGHNPQCAETVAANLERYFPDREIILLMGVLADKDHRTMTEILGPCAAAFVTVAPDNPRKLDSAALAEELRRFGKPVYDCGGVTAGVDKALALAGDGEQYAVCAVGSLYMAGEIRQRVLEQCGGDAGERS